MKIQAVADLCQAGVVYFGIKTVFQPVDDLLGNLSDCINWVDKLSFLNHQNLTLNGWYMAKISILQASHVISRLAVS